MQNEESHVFAWVPTLTSISRQALFAAEPPLYFKGSLTTSQKEEQHWRKFWEDSGFKRGNVYLRARIYDNEAFQKKMQKEVENAVSWPGFGLPPDCYVLLAKGRSAFISEGEEVISHGGISLEEVIVLFVRIWEE